MGYVLNDCGVANGAAATVDGYTFQPKLYSPEESAGLRREAFSAARILLNQPALAEELEIEGAPLGGQRLCTFHEGVKDKKILRFVQFGSTARSAANSSASGNCGFIPGSTENESELRTLVVQGLRQDDELCLDNFIKTYFVGQLAPGFKNGERAPMEVQDALLAGMLKEGRKKVDAHAWEGDYKNQTESVTHVDGWVKIAYQSISSAVAPVYTFTFSALSAAGHVAVNIDGGGAIRYYAFDTNLATTLGNIRTDLLTTAPPVDRMTLLPILGDVTVSGGTQLVITGKPGVKLNPQIVITAAATTASWCGVTLEASTAVSGETVTKVETTAASGLKQPIAIPVAAITSGTSAWDQLTNLRDAILEKNPALLAKEGFYYAVAPNVFGALQNYMVDKKLIATGDNMAFPFLSFHGKPVVMFETIRPHGIYATHPDAVHFGTDLGTDFNSIQTGYEQKEGTVWFKGGFTMGFQISHLREFAGTLENASSGTLMTYHTWGAAQPTERVFA